MQVAIGARVMLRRNVCTEDGLVNGAMGLVVGYEWPGGHRTAAEQPCGLRVLFDDPGWADSAGGTEGTV